MTRAFSSGELERFRASLAHRTGLWFEDAKLGLLSQVLEQRLDARGDDVTPYLRRWESPPEAEEELTAVARALTVGETYFFRHFDQFRAFSEVALPERQAARQAAEPLRLMSAGCASGEEAYSLAILVREHGVTATRKVDVLGVDVNPDALRRAASARYSTWSLRETPEPLRRRWFTAEGQAFALVPALHGSVRFEQQNLVGPECWTAGELDVVFCRNVLMYFTPEAAEHVVARIARALSPGGYLFLGHAENLRGLTQEFQLCHTHGTFYYLRKAGRAARAMPPLPQVTQAAMREETPLSSLPAEWTSSWLETVQRATDRIEALSGQAVDEDPARPARELPRADLAPALELLGHERFGDALEVLDALPSTRGLDSDALLLKAVLLTHSGQVDAAESACHELLRSDELSSGAHYLLALLSERRGDLKGAVEHDQIAAYLDPTFSMPKLHLGLLSRRAGERELAERELGQALHLLQREEAAKVLLFGGGFRRETLVALCRAELEQLGGRQ